MTSYMKCSGALLYRARVAGTSWSTVAVGDGDLTGDAGAAAWHTDDAWRRRLTVGVDVARLAQSSSNTRQSVIACSVPRHTAALTVYHDVRRRHGGGRRRGVVAVYRAVDRSGALAIRVTFTSQPSYIHRPQNVQRLQSTFKPASNKTESFFSLAVSLDHQLGLCRNFGRCQARIQIFQTGVWLHFAALC